MTLAGGRCHYFAVQFQVFKIEDSPLAPFFSILAQPMHWNKTPRHPATTPSPRRVAYHNFFERLLGELKLRDATITQMSRVGNDN